MKPTLLALAMRLVKGSPVLYRGQALVRTIAGMQGVAFLESAGRAGGIHRSAHSASAQNDPSSTEKTRSVSYPVSLTSNSIWTAIRLLPSLVHRFFYMPFSCFGGPSGVSSSVAFKNNPSFFNQRSISYGMGVPVFCAAGIPNGVRRIMLLLTGRLRQQNALASRVFIPAALKSVRGGAANKLRVRLQ